MADGDLVISFRTEADAREFEKATKGVKLSAEEIAKIVARLGGVLGDTLDEKYVLQFGARVDGLSEVQKLSKALTENQKAYRDLVRAIEQKNKADQGSLTNIRQSLNQAKQKLASLSKENAKYQEQAQRVNELVQALRRAEGIQVGSIADIGADVKGLERRLQVENLSAEARQRLTDQLNAYNVQADRARGIEEGSIADLQRRQKEQQRLSETLRVGSEAQVTAALNAKKLGDQIAAASPKTLTLIGAFNKLATIQAGLTAITSAFAQISGAVNQVVNRLKEVEAFDLALRNVGATAAESADFFQQAADTALRLGAPIQQVEKSYKRIIPALRGIGTSSEDSVKFIDNLTARTQVLGLSTEQSGRFMEAFAQVLSKGKLQSEELNQQISELDGGFRVQLANALGVTTTELTKMVEQGEITNDVFVETFINMQNGVDALAGRIRTGNATIQQLQNSIQTISVKNLEVIGKSIEPGIKAFLQAGDAFARLVGDIAKSEVGKLLFEVFNQVGATVRNLVFILSDLTKVFLTLAAPVAKLLQLLTPIISVLLTLKTAYVAAAIATKGFQLATTFLNKNLPAAALNLVNLRDGVNAFGLAIRALYSGQFIQFLQQLRVALANAILAMNIPVVNQFVQALQNLTKARAAGSAMDFISVASQKFSGSMQGLGDLVNKVGFSLGLFTARAKAMGLQLAKNIGDFFKFRKAADGTRIAYEGVGRAAADAIIDVSANATVVGREVVPALGRVGKTAGLANGQLGRAAGGAGLFLRSLLGFVKFTVVGTVVTSVLTGLVQVFNGMSAAGDAAKKPIAELEGTLRELGIQTSSTNGVWLGFLDTLKKVPGLRQVGNALNDIGDRLKALGLNVGGGTVLSNLGDKFGDIEKAAREAGLNGISDFANASKLSVENANKLTAGLEAQEKAALDTAAGYESQIAELKKSGGATAEQIRALEGLRDAAQASADKAFYFKTQWEKSTSGLKKSKAVYASTGDALKDIRLAQAAYFSSIDTDKQAQLNELQNQAAKGQVSSSTLVSQSAKIQADATAKKIAAIQREKKALEDRSKKSANLDYAAFRRIQELNQQEQQLRSNAAVAGKELSEEELAALKERTDKVNELGNAYKELISTTSSALGDISSEVGGAIESIADAARQQAVLEFSITGDQSFLDQTLANQAKVLDFQYTIGRVKVQQQAAEKQFELEMQKLKLETALIEARSKAAGGDPIATQTVAALEKQLGLIPQIQAANALTTEAALAGLEAETQQKQNQLNLALQARNLPPINIVNPKSSTELSNQLDSLAGKGKQISEDLANATTGSVAKGTQAINGALQQTDTTLKGVAGTAGQAGASFDQAISNLEKGLAKLDASELAKGISEGFSKGPDEFNKKIKESPENVNKLKSAVSGLADQFLGVVNPVQRIQDEIKTVMSLVNQLNGMVGRMPSGGARALGGPVSGGQTYLVNDGGGREAFMNRSGQISLLPAGRNIRWRAPGDGFVLPAPMTASLVQNSKINAQIAAVNNSARANPSGNYHSGIADSGNLIQRMGAMMSNGTTQRITNNVTIQSQSPVMDASRIMANVARLKARRGLRG